MQLTPRAAACTKRKTLGTAGEQEVIRLVVQGLLNKQIAARLDLSEITVKVRRGNAMRKMQTASLAERVRVAEKLGMQGGASSVLARNPAPDGPADAGARALHRAPAFGLPATA